MATTQTSPNEGGTPGQARQSRWSDRYLKEDREAIWIGVGGAVCGVSASPALAASVGAKKERLYTSVTPRADTGLCLASGTFVVPPAVCRVFRAP